MDLHETNPAGRLWLFANFTLSENGLAQLRTVWEEYFHTHDPAQYLLGMAGIVALPQQIRDAVNGATGLLAPKDVLLRPIDQIESMIVGDVAGSNQVKWFAASIDSGRLSDLEHCSYALSNLSKTPVVRSGTLEQIREMASEIALLVAEDDTLSDVVREEILRYAHDLLRAVDLYNVRGAKGFEEQLDRFLGTNARLKLKENTPSSLWKKVNDVSVVVLLAVQAFTAPADMQTAIESYGHLLEIPASIEAPAAPTDTEPPATQVG